MQACAKEGLGREDFTVPGIYDGGKSENDKYPALGPATAHLFPSSEMYEPWRWQQANYDNTWFIDALTIDPTALLAGRSGIFMRGFPQPVRQSLIENANVGSLPKVLVYVAVHPLFGAHVFFPFHGAKHGGNAEKKAADKGMYQGFEFWYEGLSDDELQYIKDCNYYNMEEIYELSELKAAAFDPRMFTVRDPPLPPPPPRPTT